MTQNPKLRPIGIGFICGGLGMLAAAVVAKQPMFLGSALPFLGVGIVAFAQSRRVR